MELVDIDINEDNLDFSQVIIMPIRNRITIIIIVNIFMMIINMVDMIMIIIITQVCQIAARFQDEGDERQVWQSFAFWGEIFLVF